MGYLGVQRSESASQRVGPGGLGVPGPSTAADWGPVAPEKNHALEAERRLKRNVSVACGRRGKESPGKGLRLAK